jgi:hypothetical protein
MNNILICADGGAASNFIAALLRLFKNPNYLQDFNLTLPDNGCCDYMGSAALFEYLRQNIKTSIAPERSQGADIIYNALAHVDLKKYSWKELVDEPTVDILHYVEPAHINRFLTIDNLNVILIKTKKSDDERVAINKLIKNYFVKNPDMDRFKEHIVQQLIWNKFHNSAEYIKSIDNLNNIPQQVKKDILACWVDHVRRRSSIPLPAPHEKLLILYFDEVMNQRDMVIDKIGKFIGCSSNDNLLQFYNEYLSKHPTMESYLNC